ALRGASDRPRPRSGRAGRPAGRRSDPGGPRPAAAYGRVALWRVCDSEPRTAPVNSARLAVSGVAPAPAAVLAQLEPLRVIPFALVGLVVAALALFTSKSRSDPH